VALVIDIVRHGEALPATEGGDRQRRLAPAGVQGLSRLAERLTHDGWKPDRVFSSPVPRARDSAEILTQRAGSAARVETIAALEPDADPSELVDALAARGVTTGHVVIVGHQPLLGRLVGYLTGSERGLAPGTLVRVNCPEGACQAGGEVVLILAPQDEGGA
jgi:phosphohistidine phosphatase